MTAPFTVEVHFQDGFSGEAIELLVDGRTVARFAARTRYQTNLAHIERLEILPNQKITIQCAGLPARTIAGGTSPAYIVVRKVGDQLELEKTEQSPGYV
jgi:hypothetical protein